jgi:hypothetical protein
LIRLRRVLIQKTFTSNIKTFLLGCHTTAGLPGQRSPPVSRPRRLDRFSEQAYDIISSPRTRQSFDLSQEPASESDRFGKHEFGQSLLLAARLIKVRGGQAIGATDAIASELVDGGFSSDDLAASFFHNIGIDSKTEFRASVGRPVTLVRDGSPIRPLF